MKRFETHSHTEYSNITLLDSINKMNKLVDYAIEQGLSGIAITDHECLAGSVKINKRMKELHEAESDFKLAIGNEIYLVDERGVPGQKHYHFILISKNADGHRALRELSSLAWEKSYFDRGVERRDTLKTELKAILEKYPNSLIATSACLGGELSDCLNKIYVAKKTGDTRTIPLLYKQAIDFVKFGMEAFGDDFYIECAPSLTQDQFEVNKELKKIAEYYNIKMVIGTDAHYLKKEDAGIHEAYLNSKDGEREVASFYTAAYLQTEEEIIANLAGTGLSYAELVANSASIYDKIEYYDLFRFQHIPEEEVHFYPKRGDAVDASHYPVLARLFQSDNEQERHWVNECFIGLKDKELINKPEYIERLEEEARVHAVIGEKLETCIFAYPNTLQYWIDLFWECGSTVGAGRGSACSALNHYLLGITQLDPLAWDLPFWRLNQRNSLPA